MKNIIIFLAMIFVVLPCFVFSQSNSNPKFTKEEAISVLRANYLFMYFKNPTDTMATINGFVENIVKITPVDREKQEKIKSLILSSIRQKPEEFSANSILGVIMDIDTDCMPVMGKNMNELIKTNFSMGDYQKISHGLKRGRIKANFAYQYMVKLYQDEPFNKDGVFINRANPKGMLDVVFKYYNI